MSIDVPGDTPLLWAIRDFFLLTGTKYGCGIGLCGACTVHVDGHPVRSCILTVAAVETRNVRTSHRPSLGLSEQECLDRLHAPVALVQLRVDSGAKELLRSASAIELAGGEFDIDTCEDVTRMQATLA